MRRRVIGNMMGQPSGGGGGNWWEAGGVPTPLAAYESKGAVSLAASYVDLTGNNNDCIEGDAPTLTADGWEFNGTSNYLQLPFSGDDFSSSGADCSIAIKFLNASETDLNYYFGALESTRYLFAFNRPELPRIASRFGPSGGWDYQGAALPDAALVLRGNSGAYADGSAVGSALGASGSGPRPVPLLLGAVNISTGGISVANHYGGVIQAFAIWDSVISAAEAQAVSSALANI